MTDVFDNAAQTNAPDAPVAQADAIADAMLDNLREMVKRYGDAKGLAMWAMSALAETDYPIQHPESWRNRCEAQERMMRHG